MRKTPWPSQEHPGHRVFVTCDVRRHSVAVFGGVAASRQLLATTHLRGQTHVYKQDCPQQPADGGRVKWALPGSNNQTCLFAASWLLESATAIGYYTCEREVWNDNGSDSFSLLFISLTDTSGRYSSARTDCALSVTSLYYWSVAAMPPRANCVLERSTQTKSASYTMEQSPYWEANTSSANQ
jgi:hypothetical protein